MSQADQLRQFYVQDGRYEAWKKGEAVGDSTTPATYCAQYRQHIVDLIDEYSIPQGKGQSLGCGNCAVEKLLVEHGHGVLCTDILDCSEFAAQAGARFSLFNVLQPDYASVLPKQSDFIYADGILGHLIGEEGGVQRFFQTCTELLKEKGLLVISNDPCMQKGVKDAEANPDVPGFHFVDEQHLIKQLPHQGFELIKSAPFIYERPYSGQRERVVILASRL